MTTGSVRPDKSTTVRAHSLALRAVRGYFRALSALAPSLAERHATRMFFTPHRRSRRAPGPIAGVKPVPFRVRAGGETMQGWRYGSGPAVVFVHGWGGSASDWIAVAAPVVAAGYTAVLCDFPAHGLSSGRRTTLPAMARALHALADELAFTARGRFEPLEAVVAHSFGGAATALATRDGLLARSLVLLAPVAYPMSFLDPVAETLGLSRERRDGMAEIIRARVGGDLGTIDVPRAITQVHTRGLVIHDRDDAAVDWTQGRDIAAVWPGAEFVTTAGLGHRGVLRDETVGRSITAFIRAGTMLAARPGRTWPTVELAVAS